MLSMGGAAVAAYETYRARADSRRAKGLMSFDTADLAKMEADSTLNDVITHEMGHVLGIGTIWDLKGLLRRGGTSNPTFAGVGAMEEYRVLRGAGRRRRVPVENSGG